MTSKFTRKDFELLRSEVGVRRCRIITDSMVPLIKVGEEIVVDVGNRDVKRWDMVVFWHDDKLICHVCWHVNQILAGENNVLITRPLAYSGSDAPITHDKILGKVIDRELSWLWKLRLAFRSMRRRR